MMVEEIPDDEQINIGPSLPEGANSLLMTKREYLETLLKGRKGKPPIKIAMIKPDNSQKTRCQCPRYVEPERQECQPTSSKVKVEDLVMDNQEGQVHLEEERQQPATKM